MAERDLWMVTDGASTEVALYADLTGRRIEPAALAYFRLAWDLADLDVFLEVLRSPHDEDDDTRLAFQAVTGILSQGDVGRSVGRIE